jgi:homoserine O-acetyltransferase
MIRILLILTALVFSAPAYAGDDWRQTAKEGDHVVKNFTFASGEAIPELRLHYTTLGEAKRDKDGRVTNAVMILHGTGGSGQQFYRPQFADVLFKKSGLLDPAKYYIILPDGIGHGKSSKPSDGLKAKFPHYDYADMVAAQHDLLTKGLGIDNLQLIIGTSMGCMQGFMWGEAYPDFAKALMPLACLPVEIAGRNRMWRKLVIDAITTDPDWKNGNYERQPTRGLRTAASLLLTVGAAPLPLQISHPTREETDAYVKERMTQYLETLDANDFLYQVSASRTYDPSPGLEKIKARVVWINSADDFINPPELGVAEREAKRLANGRFVLIPASEKSQGHATHSWAALWEDELRALLADAK